MHVIKRYTPEHEVTLIYELQNPPIKGDQATEVHRNMGDLPSTNTTNPLSMGAPARTISGSRWITALKVVPPVTKRENTRSDERRNS